MAPWPKSTRKKILPVFEKRYPGVKVSQLDVTSDQLVTRATTEARAGKTLGDIFQVAEVAQKVTVVLDDEAEAIYPSTRLGKVSLETKQGQQYSAKVFYPKGSPENPLSENELREKFLGLAGMVLSGGRAQQLFDAIQNIEQIRDTVELAQLLTTDL